MDPRKWFEEEIKRYKDDFDFRLEGLILDFTKQIALIMENKKIRRSELAAKMEVSRPYVTEILAGKPNLTFESMLKLADALGANLQITLGVPSVAEAFVKSSKEWHGRGISSNPYKVTNTAAWTHKGRNVKPVMLTGDENEIGEREVAA
ncbi:MAG TPA: helix-turn-helix transcriptional regulator [Nitrospiria bacterium]|nr:helix-turn-helix transcriptional regulator [Nitrospiria bacterium]